MRYHDERCDGGDISDWGMAKGQYLTLTRLIPRRHTHVLVITGTSVGRARRSPAPNAVFVSGAGVYGVSE